MENSTDQDTRILSGIAKGGGEPLLKAMPTVAEQLRQAREQQKLSVQDVAEITKIKTDHIRALEQGAYEVFAAPVYIRGFVRSYATMLRLPVSRLLGELDSELAGNERVQATINLSPPRPRTLLDGVSLLIAKLNWRVVTVLGAVAVLVGLAVWTYRTVERRRSVDPLQNLGPGLYQPPPSGGGETLPLPTPTGN